MNSFIMLCYCTVLLAVLPSHILAQSENPIPNAGFESWNGNNPEGWTVANFPGSEVVTPSGESHSDMFAARLAPNILGAGVLTPLLQGGSDPVSGIAIATRYQTLSGFLKYFPLNSDSLSIEVFMNIEFTTIGTGQISFQDTVSSYVQFDIPITYMASGTPDRAFINIAIRGVGNQDPTVGTYALLDDLQFDSNTTSVEDDLEQLPAGFMLRQNYPNPFNPQTSIGYELAQSETVELVIFNLFGQAVRVLVDEAQPAGVHEVRWDGADDLGNHVASGFYLYRIKAGAFSQTKKMLLLR